MKNMECLNCGSTETSYEGMQGDLVVYLCPHCDYITFHKED